MGSPETAKPPLTEKDFQQLIIDTARALGWLVYHTHDSRRSAPGFPDLILLRPPELVVVEVKPAAGSRRATVADVAARPEWLRHPDLTNEQAEWLAAFGKLGAALRAKGALHSPEGDERVSTAPAWVEVHIWRPGDADEVERRLARGRNLIPSINRPA